MTAEPDEDLAAAFDSWSMWMGERFTVAADRWGFTTLGTPTVGGRGMLNAYGPVRDNGRAGRQWWLRIGVQFDGEPTDDILWTGNEAANAVTGVHKPRVVDVAEWRDRTGADWPCTVRAEAMTFIGGRPIQDPLTCAWTGIPPEDWWASLDDALDAIHATPVGPERRRDHDPAALIRETLGVDIEVQHWASEHGDLHWANLHRDPFGIVDWESWGQWPTGTGIAHLYFTALPVPELAAKVRERYAPVLDSEDGRVAQLVRGAHLMRVIRDGRSDDLAELLPPVLRSLGAKP